MKLISYIQSNFRANEKDNLHIDLKKDDFDIYLHGVSDF